MNFVKKFFQRVTQIPSGFKKVFAETKEVMALSKKKKTLTLKNLNRRQEELMRTNHLALSKLVTFFLAQIPPIIGYIPLFVYFSYPRQLLTHHFWSEEEKTKFPVEQYAECRIHANALAKFVETRKEAINFKTSLDTLPAAHLESLAGANNICSSQTVLKLAPTILLKRWLKSRSRELVLDDTLLRLEGVNDLDTIELQNACVRRGLNPCVTSQSVESLKTQLKQWIGNPVVKVCQNETHIPSAFLMHATALPKMFIDETTSKDSKSNLKND